jgi:hypothetical protein
MAARAFGKVLVTGVLTRRNQIAALAARHAVPTIHDLWEYTAAGGLASCAILSVGSTGDIGQ